MFILKRVWNFINAPKWLCNSGKSLNENDVTRRDSFILDVNARLRKRATLWLFFLGPLFLTTYTFANWWTSQLPHVGSLVFQWEKNIPFIDWTIIPYVSIDVFYIASLYICATRTELDTLGKRLAGATLISVAGFLLFPLQFSFERPDTVGLSGHLFGYLAGFDKPYNQAPSLHMSELVILWVIYARHLHGAARWALHGWFFLIGVSIFTTYQHHVIDGLSGAIVGVVCLYLFPEHPRKWSHGSSANAGAKIYQTWGCLFGGIVCLTLAGFFGGWYWVLLWPGTACMLIALAHNWVGMDIFQKHQGQASWPARILLAPYLIGAWLLLRCFARHDPCATNMAGD
jgi:hypothetical protein